MRLVMFTILGGSQTPETSSMKINERTCQLFDILVSGGTDGYLAKNRKKR